MKAYELMARLNHLTLAGQNNDGQLEWIGTDRQWQTMEWEEFINEGINL